MPNFEYPTFADVEFVPWENNLVLFQPPPPLDLNLQKKGADKYSIAGKFVNLRFFQEIFFKEPKDPLSRNKFLTPLYLHKSV